MTPLVQSMSVFTTLALLMVTPPSLTATLAVLPSTVLTSWPSSLTTAAARTLPGITWYLRMAISLSLFSGLRRLSTVPSGSLPKASSVGGQGSKFVTGNFIYTRNASDRHLPGVSQARAAGCLAYSTINSDLRCGRWAPTYRFHAFPVATWGVEGVAWPAVSWRRGGRGAAFGRSLAASLAIFLAGFFASAAALVAAAFAADWFAWAVCCASCLSARA